MLISNVVFICIHSKSKVIFFHNIYVQNPGSYLKFYILSLLIRMCGRVQKGTRAKQQKDHLYFPLILGSWQLCKLLSSLNTKCCKTFLLICYFNVYVVCPHLSGHVCSCACRCACACDVRGQQCLGSISLHQFPFPYPN